jgi:hypothetical protein
MLRVGRKLRDLWIYFKTGHNGYLTYTLSILNFIVLQHRLLIDTIPFLSKYISSLSLFVVLFFFTYIPMAVLIGFFEFRKGELKRRPMLNPYIQATLQAQILQNQGLFSYMEGNTEEAKTHLEDSLEVLRRWRLR